MGISKVVFGGDVLIDLSSDTVSASALLRGVTAHDAKGNKIVGTYTPPAPVTKVLATFPQKAMTADDESSTTGLKASASSVTGTYYAYKAFSAGTLTTSWASAADINQATGSWIQIQLPKKLAKIRVVMTSRSATAISNPSNISIDFGSGGNIETITEEHWFVGDEIVRTDILHYLTQELDETLYKKASTVFCDVQCGNDTEYDTVRITVNEFYRSATNIAYVSIGDIRIEGLYTYE